MRPEVKKKGPKLSNLGSNASKKKLKSKFRSKKMLLEQKMQPVSLNSHRKGIKSKSQL